MRYPGPQLRANSPPQTHKPPPTSNGAGPASRSGNTSTGRTAAATAVERTSETDRQALGLIEDCILPYGAALRERTSGAPDTPLPPEDRCLSPSDFGFHNALEESSGRLRFFDFEYAGWDDPAKTVCDFFCQPALPVPREHLPDFLDAVTEAVEDADSVRRRVRLLMPVYYLKWVTIMLNVFLPVGLRRRGFAQPEMDVERHKVEQLDKVRWALTDLPPIHDAPGSEGL